MDTLGGTGRERGHTGISWGELGETGEAWCGTGRVWEWTEEWKGLWRHWDELGMELAALGGRVQRGALGCEGLPGSR